MITFEDINFREQSGHLIKLTKTAEYNFFTQHIQHINIVLICAYHMVHNSVLATYQGCSLQPLKSISL